MNMRSQYPIAGITNLTIRNGKLAVPIASSQGGGLYAAGAFTGAITGARFENNSAVGTSYSSAGGALYMEGNFAGTLGSGTIFSGNKATSSTAAKGGALYTISNFTGAVTDTRFEGNSATGGSNSGQGGAVYVNRDFTGTFGSGTVFSKNVADGFTFGEGGAVYVNQDFTGSITDTRFDGNTATAFGNASSIANGGAIYVNSDFTGSIGSGTVFSGNTATGKQHGQGGAVSVLHEFTGSIVGARFENNTAKGNDDHAYGGAIYTQDSFAGSIGSGTVFSGNTADGNLSAFGGALFSLKPMSADITGARFKNNIAKAANMNAFGGAIATEEYDFTGDIASSRFENNQATAANFAYGGALSAASITTTIGSGSAFVNNAASGGTNSLGGAIFAGAHPTYLLPPPDTTITLDGGNAGTVLFQGNRAGGRANSIHFGRYDNKSNNANASLVVRTAAGGTVALHDPVSVDLNNGKTFAMTVSGSGEFIWGGRNDLAANGGSTVHFDSGAHTHLNPDFQLTNLGDRFTVGVVSGTGNIGTLAVTFQPGSTFTLDLTGRPTGDALPLFFRGDVTKTGVFTLDGAMHITTAPLLTFDEFDDTWLLADVAGVTADTFRISAGSPLFTASLVQDNDKYYVGVNNAGVMANTRGSANQNVASAYAAGQFSDAWAAYLATPGGKEATHAQRSELFLDLAGNPQNYIAEAALSFMGQSFAMQDSTVSGAWGKERASRDAWEQAAAAASTTALASPFFAPGRNPLRFWGGYVGGKTRLSAADGYYGSKSHFNGGTVGLSYDFSPCVTLGGWFTHAIGISRANDLNSKGKTKADSAGLFLSLRPSMHWTVDLDAAYGRYQNDLRRDNLSGAYSADYDQHIFSMGGKLSYHIDAAGFRISPYAGLRYQRLKQDSFREQGGAFAFHMGSTDADSFASRLGVEVSREYAFACGRSIIPQLRAGWRHEFGDRRYSASGGFVSAPQTYRLHSGKMGRDALEAGLGVRAVLVRTDRFRLDAEVSYDIDVRDNYVGQNWYAGVGLQF